VVSWGTAQNGPIPKILGCDLCNTDVTQSPWVDNLSVYGLKFDYKFAYGTLTGTTNQYNRKLNFNFDSTPILVSFDVPIADFLEQPTIAFGGHPRIRLQCERSDGANHLNEPNRGPP